MDTIVEQVKTLTANGENIEIFVDMAKQAVIQRLYPFDETKTDIPDRYRGNVIQIAVYLYNKQGAEGQMAHSENGISRSYESSGIPESMLSDIIPYARCI